MSNLKRYYTVLFIVCTCVFIVLAPSFNFDVWTLYNQKRTFQGIVLFLGMSIFYWAFIKYQLALPRLYLWLTSFLGCFLTLSIVNAAQPKWALIDIGWYIILIQVALVFAFLHGKNPTLFKSVLYSTAFIMALIYSIRVIISLSMSWIDSQWPVWPNIEKFKLVINGIPVDKKGFIGFGNFRFLNHIHTWSLPILVSGYFYYKDRMVLATRVCILLVISFWWSLVFATGARGTMISLAVSAIVVSLLFSKESWKWLKVLISTCIAGAIIHFITFDVIFASDGRTIARFQESARLELWAYALNLFASHPVLGIGPMHYSQIKYGLTFASPHNIYVQILAEWGLISLLLFFSLMGSLLKKWIQFGYKNYSLEKLTITSVLIAGIVHSAVSGIFSTPIAQILFCIALGWAFSTYHTSNNIELFKRRGELKFKNVVLIIIFLLINIMTFKIFIETGSQVNKSKELYFQKTNKHQLAPRFWDQGFIDADDGSN